MLWGLLLALCMGAIPGEGRCADIHDVENGTPLRRSISAEQPAWIIHIDVWNYADPQKIIDMVPEDVRPFVIFNIATSSSDEKSPNGPAIYDSWMKVCAQNRVWTMIQCASGAANRMPDDGTTAAYEEYFKLYPNFLGFNFAEQFWGFGDEGRVDFPTRLQLFADLMPICHRYGGYLAVSFTDSYYNASKMPLGWLKRNVQMREFLAADPEHFLCFEKYTLKKNFFDIESNCFGTWLGGYAGQYGIRFDSSGWLNAGDVTDQTRGTSPFVRAAGAIPVVEHAMLTGQTMMDGPELTWQECSQEVGTTSVDGFSQRNWAWFPQFENISLDLFRKILDGTIRIPARSEVIDRTKVCIVNDINRNLSNENERNSYVTPERLFDGLYRSDEDQGGTSNHWIANRWWMKRTGRYPTIPQTYAEVSGLKTFRKSSFDKASFDAWMHETFPSEYSGDIFAGRHENGWVIYNPYQYDETTDAEYRVCGISTRRANGSIPLQYNTCDSLAIDFAPYSLAVVKEQADCIDVYLTNYQAAGTLSDDVICIGGASSQPVVTWADRGNHTLSTVNSQWSNGLLTITVRHNGPLDLHIECKGKATGRRSAFTQATITTPQAPPAYTGALQYEAEVADYRNCTIRKSGYNQNHDGYFGQGFAEMTSRQSALRFNTRLPKAGYYLLTLRLQADAAGSVKVGESDVLAVPESSEWKDVTSIIRCDEGAQQLMVQNAGGSRVYVDCIQLEPIKAEAFEPDAKGEFHVSLDDLMASGTITFDAASGTVTQAGGSGQSGALRLFFDNADFTKVISLKVTYEGDGEIFRYLIISDNYGNSVNPSGSQGAFWSSKYDLNFTAYRQSEASRNVCLLEWTANAPESQARTMTIHDICIKTEVSDSDIRLIGQDDDGGATFYDLNGQRVSSPRRGIYIVRFNDGTTRKQIF